MYHSSWLKKGDMVVLIWKGKGDRQDCYNYCGMTLLSVPGKFLVHLLLMRVRSHLLKYQRLKKSGFSPDKTTTDRIPALWALVERRREYRQEALAAYVDLKKLFDSVHYETLWNLPALPQDSCKDYWTTIWLVIRDRECCEVCFCVGGGGWEWSSFFPVHTGVR